MAGLRDILSIRREALIVCLIVSGAAAAIWFLPHVPGSRDDDTGEGTRRMAERLALIAAETTGELLPYEDAGGEGARPTGRGAQGAGAALRAGETEQAIRQLETAIRTADEALLGPEAMYRLRRHLAVAYMRLGEEENCVHDAAAAACIFPLNDEAVHVRRRGSRAAAGILTTLLQERPDDLSVRWLFNLAHMTLGSYPEGVPEPWLIALDLPVETRPLAPFRDVAPAEGLHTVGLAGGSVTEDFDRDGDLDVLATSSGIQDPIRIFLNDGEGSFKDATESAGLEGLTGGLNAVHADFDNDGLPDVFVLRGGWWGTSGLHPNSLLRNTGDGTFEDVTEEAGLLSYHPTQTAAWADYNNDGWLDLFVGNESSAMFSHPCELYRNNGDGTFSSVASDAGVAFEGYVKGVVWGDYNNDGRPDLFVSNFGGDNALFRNDGPDEQGSWRFTNVAPSAGVADHTWSFPTWFWDYDNDGWQDLLVLPFDVGILRGDPDALGAVAAEYLGEAAGVERPRLYRNNGDGTFEDVSERAGLDRMLYAMGSNFGDVDNDGYLDAYVGTGAPDFRALYPNRLFLNDGGERFVDVTSSARVGHLQKGHGVSFADLDHDGDQDIFSVVGGTYPGDTSPNVLFVNPGNDNQWITLALEGVQSNRSAVGARIRLTVEASGRYREIHRSVSTGGSFGSSSLRQEIGLGSADRLVRIEVQWPAGGVHVYEDVTTNRAYLIREGAEALEPLRLDTFRLGGAAAHEPHDHGTSP